VSPKFGLYKRISKKVKEKYQGAELSIEIVTECEEIHVG